MKEGWQKQFMDLVKPFMKSSAGESQTPPGADNQGTGETQTGITDEFFEKLQSAIETGEVAVEEAAIKAYAKTNGLNDADADSIWAIVAEGIGGDSPSGQPDSNAQTPPEDSQIQKGGNKDIDPEFVQFAKSLGAAIQSAEEHELAIAGLVEDNQKREQENKELKAEIDFLKSEFAKIMKAPIDPKTPATDISHVPPVEGRAEIVAKIVKGVQSKQLALGDLHTFKSTGRQTEAVKEFLKSSKGGINET